MARINKKFFNGEVEYGDCSIEDGILEIVKNTDDLEAIEKEDLRWPVFYNFSYLRENLFIWYPFKEDANLLEVGAGCGALTGLFCQKVSKVTAVEGTDRRAQIIYNRHKNHNNLEIFPGNIFDMEFEEKFDYIILCDVLEYASQFTQTDNPYADFLKKIKSLLNDDGIILVAVENRIGLKCFSGLNEGHLGQSFIGIDDYHDINHVTTFSRFELEELIQEAGFDNYRFFYLFQDPKFPFLIHTDEFVEKLPLLKNPPNFVPERIKFFDEGSLNASLAKDNMSKYFANSFLVELRNSDIFHESLNVKYCKLGNFRSEEFRIGTQILKDNDGFTVSKFPLNQKAVKHVENMYLHSKKTYGKIRCLESVFEDNVLYYPYLNESNLSHLVTNLLVKDSDKKGVIELLKEIYDSLKFNSLENDSYHDGQFSKVFGEKRINVPLHCHETSNIDLILGNLFIIDGEIVAIDYEWCFDFPIPIEFSFWRIINFEITQNQVFRKFFTVEEIFDILRLDMDWISVFKDWENHWVRYFKPPSLPRQSILSIGQLIMESSENKSLVQEKEKKIESLQKKVKKLKKDNSNLESKVKLMEESTSWKITSPLRKIMRKTKNIFR